MGIRFARALPPARVQKTEERSGDGHRSAETMPANKTPRHVPPGFNPVTVYLTVDDPDRLVAFAKAAFGAEELKDQRATGPDGKTMHTAFRVEGCIIETGRASGPWKALAAGIHLYVRDADETYARAVKAGGVSLHEVRAMEYGERSGAVRDPCGNHWYIATYAGAAAT
jgi:PhnB protein